MKYHGIIELFNTVQGEGATTGRLVTLVRFKNCPLTKICWFCDTKNIMLNSKELNITDDDISKYLHKTNRVMFTGGEPTMPDHIDTMFDIIKTHKDDIDDIILETNGLYIEDFLEKYFQKRMYVTGKTYISISPKPLNKELFSFYKDKMIDIIAKDIQFYEKNNIQFDLKFVIGTDDKEPKSTEMLMYVLDLIEYSLSKYSWMKKSIWLMPMGKTIEEVTSNYKRVIDTAMTYNVNVSFRLHIFGLNLDKYMKENGGLL